MHCSIPFNETILLRIAESSSDSKKRLFGCSTRIKERLGRGWQLAKGGKEGGDRVKKIEDLIRDRQTDGRKDGQTKRWIDR